MRAPSIKDGAAGENTQRTDDQLVEEGLARGNGFGLKTSAQGSNVHSLSSDS